jgi:hypothetical protein
MLKLVRQPKHQAQRDDGDCTITSLSMMTGLQWEEVLARIGASICDPKVGCGDYEGALLRLRFERTDFLIVDGENHKGTSQEFFNSLFWRRPALVTVTSRVMPDGLHTVYYDGTNVYDPAPKARQRYKDFESLDCTDFVVFRDGL